MPLPIACANLFDLDLVVQFKVHDAIASVITSAFNCISGDVTHVVPGAARLSQYLFLCWPVLKLPSDVHRTWELTQ
eukprot:4684296-Amphidinium_carterae.1